MPSISTHSHDIGGKAIQDFFNPTDPKFIWDEAATEMVRRHVFEQLTKPEEQGIPEQETILFRVVDTTEPFGFEPGSVPVTNFLIQAKVLGDAMIGGRGIECPIHAGLHLWRETTFCGIVLSSVVHCQDGHTRLFEIVEEGGVRTLKGTLFEPEGAYPAGTPIIYRVLAL